MKSKMVPFTYCSSPEIIEKISKILGKNFGISITVEKPTPNSNFLKLSCLAIDLRQAREWHQYCEGIEACLRD